MKNYIAITIGRNIDNDPMGAVEWESFQREVKQALNASAKIDGVIFTGDGLGVWGSNSEHAHCLIALCDHVDVPALRADFARIAKIYDQDAIGLVIHTLPNGNESLVYAQK
jgi:hypothetical protein